MIMGDIAMGLRTIHARSALHGDLKAMNVLVNHDPNELEFFALRSNCYHIADFESSMLVQRTGFWRALEMLAEL